MLADVINLTIGGGADTHIRSAYDGGPPATAMMIAVTRGHVEVANAIANKTPPRVTSRAPTAS